MLNMITPKLLPVEYARDDVIIALVGNKAQESKK